MTVNYTQRLKLLSTKRLGESDEIKRFPVKQIVDGSRDSYFGRIKKYLVDFTRAYIILVIRLVVKCDSSVAKSDFAEKDLKGACGF